MNLHWYHPRLAALNLKGQDASDFLQRLTTQDFKNFNLKEKKYAAFLEPSSMIKHLFLTEKAGEAEFILWSLPESQQQLRKDLEKFHFAEDLIFEILPQVIMPHSELSEIERVDQGFFKWGVDVTEKNLLLEIPYENFLAEQKGCYPGQEVVERVFTYGKVAKKLVLLDLNQWAANINQNEIIYENKKIGRVTSLGNKKAFAYLQKPFYEQNNFFVN